MASPKSGIVSLSEGRSDLLKIDPRNLNIKPGFNFRDMNSPDNIEHVDELARSIAEIGVKVPLICYWEDGKAWVSSGHCRHAAAIRAIEVYKAPLETVPVQIEERHSNEADRIFGQITYNKNNPFTDLEKAKVFKKLLDLGWQQNDIASKSGMTASRVSQILAVLTAPVAVQGMISKGEVSSTLAMQVVKSEGSKAEQILKDGLEGAKADGKTKVTASNLTGTPRANLKKLLTEVLDQSDINDSSEVVVIRMSEEDYASLLEAIGKGE